MQFLPAQRGATPYLKRRMLEVVQEINRAGLSLQGGRSGARCLEARRNVGRPAWQAVLRRLNRANLMPELDVDYNAGAAWLADNDMRVWEHLPRIR